MATLYKKNAKMKMTGSIIAAAGKKNNNKKKKCTGSIIGPAMAGPTGPFATALSTKCYNEVVIESQQFNKLQGWIERPVKGQPTITLQARIVPSDYACNV